MSGPCGSGSPRGRRGPCGPGGPFGPRGPGGPCGLCHPCSSRAFSHQACRAVRPSVRVRAPAPSQLHLGHRAAELSGARRPRVARAPLGRPTRRLRAPGAREARRRA
eukprot:7680124-Lingulodinium_polyedra.AAC.1